MSTRYQVVSWTSLSGLVQLVVVGNKSYSVSGSQFGRGAICRQFWWEVASSIFCASKPLFWLVGWWRDKIWCRGKPICGGAPFIADSRWRWPSAYRVLPTRQFRSWLSWLCDIGIVQDGDRLLQSSSVAQKTGKDYNIGTRSKVPGIRVY